MSARHLDLTFAGLNGAFALLFAWLLWVHRKDEA